jgi:hypothetical protein
MVIETIILRLFMLSCVVLITAKRIVYRITGYLGIIISGSRVLVLLGLERIAIILIIILVGALVVYYLRIIRVINPGREIYYVVDNKREMTIGRNGLLFGRRGVGFVWCMKVIFIQQTLRPLTYILIDGTCNRYNSRLWVNREVIFGTYRTTRFCVYGLLRTILITLKWLFRK